MKKNTNKRHHAHLVEAEDEEEEERPRKRQAREEGVEEYVLLCALSRSVTPREDTWLIDSGPPSTRHDYTCLMSSPPSMENLCAFNNGMVLC